MIKSILLFALISAFCTISKVSYTQIPNWQWAKSIGGIGMDRPLSTCVDAAGNLYLAGYFYSSTLVFGADTLVNMGGSDIFLSKYDVNGNILWAKSMGGSKEDNAMSIAVDAADNLYVAGSFESSTINFDSTVLTNVGECNLFLTKYDSSGNVLWAKSTGGSVCDEAKTVAVDAIGNIYLAGIFSSPLLKFGLFTLTNTGNINFFLTKYSPDGNVLWALSNGGTGSDEARSVAVDAIGDIYLAGTNRSPILILGSDTLMNAGESDIFLAKYNANGNVLWATSAAGVFNDFDPFIAAESSGNVYLTGSFVSPTLIFGFDTLSNMGAVDIFISKYDANGNFIWAKSTGGWESESPKSIAMDAAGNAYILGDFYGSKLTFGSITILNSQIFRREIFLVKYDINGDVLWANSAGGADMDYASSISIGISGNSCVAGYFESPILIFGSTTLVNISNNFDTFLAKFDCSLGIIDLNQPDKALTIYPNPTFASITLENQTKGHLTILNLHGQLILQQEITEHRTILNTSNLSSGVYFVRVTGEKSVQIAKFVKK